MVGPACARHFAVHDSHFNPIDSPGARRDAPPVNAAGRGPGTLGLLRGPIL